MGFIGKTVRRGEMIAVDEPGRIHEAVPLPAQQGELELEEVPAPAQEEVPA